MTTSTTTAAAALDILVLEARSRIHGQPVLLWREIDRASLTAGPAARAEDGFHLCPACDRVYSKGSHYRRMLRLAGRTLRVARRSLPQ